MRRSDKNFHPRTIAGDAGRGLEESDTRSLSRFHGRRFNSSFGSGRRPEALDVHALGMQQKVRRKFIRTGQRAVTARLHLGASKAVLRVPASAIAEHLAIADAHARCALTPLTLRAAG